MLITILICLGIIGIICALLEVGLIGCLVVIALSSLSILAPFFTAFVRDLLSIENWWMVAAALVFLVLVYVCNRR